MELNIKQKMVLTISALLITATIIFPPTYYITHDIAGEKTTVFSGYRFVGTLETNTQSTQVPSFVNREVRVLASIYHIEPIRLSFQLIGIVLVAGILLLIFNNPKN